ncbi:homocysteine S-methyltransferase, partial [Streptococcus agalactiae]|nr:homocysteine S-methyltransferase [Streptococcus agalactiae]
EYTGLYDIDKEGLKNFHRHRIELLLDEGVDLLALETIPSAQEAEALIELLAEDFPQVEAYMSFTSQDGKTISDGSAVADLAKAIDVSPQVVALGINCSSPSLVADFLQAIAEQTNKPLVTYPNSGEVYDGASQSWQSSPDHSHTLLENTSDWQKLGAQVVGGCCRTRPADIADLSAHLT